MPRARLSFTEYLEFLRGRGSGALHSPSRLRANWRCRGAAVLENPVSSSAQVPAKRASEIRLPAAEKPRVTSVSSIRGAPRNRCLEYHRDQRGKGILTGRRSGPEGVSHHVQREPQRRYLCAYS